MGTTLFGRVQCARVLVCSCARVSKECRDGTVLLLLLLLLPLLFIYTFDFDFDFDKFDFDLPRKNRRPRFYIYFITIEG